MSITGNLKTMELAELLQWLAQSNKTGTLVIDNGKVEKKIFFARGKVISSASSDPNEHLGHFLVSHGYINEQELAQAMAMQETGKMLLGKILLTIGVVSESDLNRMLRLKAEESIYEIFSWEQGEFRFLDDELPRHAMVPIALEVTGLVLNGMQRLDEWKLIREHIPSRQCVPVAVQPLEPGGSEPGSEAVLRLVDDDRSIEDIALQTHSSEFHVCRILYEQVRAGRLKIVRPRSLEPPRPSAPSPLGPEPTPDAATLLERAIELLESRDFEGALRHYRAARSLDPESQTIQAAVQAGEDQIRREIEEKGVHLDAVPRLRPGFNSGGTHRISPHEAFIVSRINGSYDIRTLVKISPMPALDAQVVFWKLQAAGYIEIT